ncbi:MAG TPA: GreA/GreB family elongation factor [Rubricoccaceae bacterium]|jgi:transcription elongation factor GreB
MSRAFAKDDGPDEPPVVPPRAPLPAGVANYVTPRGLALLHDERERLTAERAAADADHTDEMERSRRLTVLSARMAQLAERMARVQLVEPRPSATARFGATVTFRSGEVERTVTIVGVDEADAAQGLVAFTSPVARALTGKTAGDAVELQTAAGPERLVVVSVSYPEAPVA